MIVRVTRYNRNTEFELADKMYCPGCGETGYLYREFGDGDYYQGSIYFCINCNTGHHLDNCNCTTDEVDLDTIKQIKEVVNGN